MTRAKQPRKRPVVRRAIKPVRTEALPQKKSPTLAEANLPAYKLNLAVELPLVSVGALLMVGWVLPLEPARCAPLCDPRDLNALDKPAAGLYDNKWGLASDIGIITVAAGVLTTLLVDEGWKNGFNDLLVVLESFVAANSLAIIFSMAARRPRPYVYGEKAPEEERNEFSASLSFYSGHVAGCFAMTFGLFNTIRRRRPGSALQWVVLGVGVALSSFVAVGRVMSGNHFPTDVLVGAAVGTAMGFAIPALHALPAWPVKPVITGTGAGLVGVF